MSDPTPFPTDPMKAEGTDPDLSSDEQTDERPDDREPTFDERQHDRLAAEEQDERNEGYPPIA